MLRFASGCNPCNMFLWLKRVELTAQLFPLSAFTASPELGLFSQAKTLNQVPNTIVGCGCIPTSKDWLYHWCEMRENFTFHQRPKCVKGAPVWTRMEPLPCTVLYTLNNPFAWQRSTVEVRADAVLPKQSSKAPHLPARPSCKWRSKSVTKQVQRKLLPHPTPSSCCHEERKWRSKSVTKQVQHTLLSHPTPTPPHPLVVTKQVSAIARQWRSKCNVRYYPTPPQPHPMPTPNSWSGKQQGSTN